MKRRNLLKAACAAILAPLYAVTGKAKPNQDNPVGKWIKIKPASNVVWDHGCNPHYTCLCAICGETYGRSKANPLGSDNLRFVEASCQEYAGRQLLVIGQWGKVLPAGVSKPNILFPICKTCFPNNDKQPLPWERYFAKHNLDYTPFDLRYYSGMRYDGEWDVMLEYVYESQCPLNREDGEPGYDFTFQTYLRHRSTGEVVRETVAMVRRFKPPFVVESVWFKPNCKFTSITRLPFDENQTWCQSWDEVFAQVRADEDYEIV